MCYIRRREVRRKVQYRRGKTNFTVQSQEKSHTLSVAKE